MAIQTLLISKHEIFYASSLSQIALDKNIKLTSVSAISGLENVILGALVPGAFRLRLILKWGPSFDT